MAITPVGEIFYYDFFSINLTELCWYKSFSVLFSGASFPAISDSYKYNEPNLQKYYQIYTLQFLQRALTLHIVYFN